MPTSTAFAIVMFDCDRLKQINDEYGHERGDSYLLRASGLICKVYAHSPVFRLGGDEFVALLQDSDYEKRENLLKRFNRMTEEINDAADNPWEEVNISRGMAVFRPDQDSDFEQVLRRADEIMYEDKRRQKRYPAI